MRPLVADDRKLIQSDKEEFFGATLGREQGSIIETTNSGLFLHLSSLLLSMGQISTLR